MRLADLTRPTEAHSIVAAGYQGGYIQKLTMHLNLALSTYATQYHRHTQIYSCYC